MNKLRAPEISKDLLQCTRFKGAADATVAVNSHPVATAHQLIDYSAVGGEKDLGTDHLITLCVTAIHCKPPWIQEVCKQSPRAIPNLFASWWLGSSFTPLLINQLSEQVQLHLASIQRWKLISQPIVLT